MAEKGIRKDVAISPRGDKSGDPMEALVPDHIELRNGMVTPNNNWRRRFGYEVAFDIANDSAVALLIDYGVGFAVLETGEIYRLDTLAKLTTKLQGKFTDNAYRPIWVIHGVSGVDYILICDGGIPVKISSATNDSSVLDDAPKGKYVARIGDYTVISGYKDAEGEFTEFSWCAVGNPLNWTTGDSGFSSVKKEGSAILNMASNGQYLYFFKEKTTEVFALIGGASTFSRHESASFEVGIAANYSLVNSSGVLIWIGDTGDVYELVGNTPRIISIKYKQAFDDLFSYDDLIGFDFYKEYKIRWFSGRHGKTFVYDYLNKIWFEENTWKNRWERLPFNSQMYFNDRCYVGSFAPDGKIYEFSQDILTDNGEPTRVFRKFQIRPFKEVSKDGFLNEARFILKRGASNDTVDIPWLMVRCRVDESNQWSLPEYIDLGVAYDKDPFVDVYFNLYGSEFEFELIETDAVEYLLTGMEVVLKPSGVRQ
jgi:hypothetical protein